VTLGPRVPSPARLARKLRLFAARRCALPAHAAAAAGVIAALAHDARAHEPFQITTEARALPSGLVLHVTLASRTAALACPSAVGAARSLTAADLDRHRTELDACARGLYVIRSADRTLAPLAADLTLTEEGDFDARLRYPAATPGTLTFEAVHLTRLPDAMYGAELTVTSERAFLGQALLRAASPALTVRVPREAAAEVPGAGPRRSPFTAYGLVASAALVVAGLGWLLRRRR
jgi:uncharacterized protein (TIGR03382 family)